jgi:hypothetical protein
VAWDCEPRYQRIIHNKSRGNEDVKRSQAGECEIWKGTVRGVASSGYMRPCTSDWATMYVYQMVVWFAFVASEPHVNVTAAIKLILQVLLLEFSSHSFAGDDTLNERL